MEQKQITGPVKAERWKRKTQSFEHTEGLLESLGFADWTDLPRIISIVGAGGKTSTMYSPCRRTCEKGRTGTDHDQYTHCEAETV